MEIDKEKCIWCGSCTVWCPTGATKQGDGCYEIDPNICINCGSCESHCPVGAISK